MAKSKHNTEPMGALMQPGLARVTVVAGVCPPGLSFVLAAERAEAGRAADAVVLKEDETLSPKHCAFVRKGGKLHVEDLDSANGVYARIQGTHVLTHGDWFRVGNQVFRFFELPEQDEFPNEAGTLFFTSPRRKGTFRVQQMLEGGKAGLSSTTSGDELTIGGDGSTVAFSADKNLSASHCKISRTAAGEFQIEDLKSTNGTYVRINGKADLSHGDYLYVGNEILRVDVV